MNKIVEKVMSKAEQLVSVTKASGKGKHVVPQQRFSSIFKELPGVQKKETSHLHVRFNHYTLQEGEVFIRILERSDGHLLELDVTEKGELLHHYRAYQKKRGEQKVTIPDALVDRMVIS
ncbi:hypothetical protein ABFG93_01970 [Pseudalkalibacillus hwajinpoensis]|uniref:hypothetical protein n=1 Tax=Guptibacillus hwajinpoensis TaxID=208199 RepID=UPI00325AC627